jgi:hypothetical protein
MSIVFAGIDGTGEYSNEKYKKTFENSFINQLSRMTHLWQGGAYYHRGPWWLGTDMPRLVLMAYGYVLKQIASGKADRVFLAGYSRGGAGVIQVASMLRAVGQTVDCLILFDPVDRSLIGSWHNPWAYTPIYDNVRQVLYAQRDPAAGSRESFGNCGQQRYGATYRDRKRQFFCTHAGVGGTPWWTYVDPATTKLTDLIDEGQPRPIDGMTNCTYQRDLSGSQEVWSWMWGYIQQALNNSYLPPKNSLPTRKPYVPKPRRPYMPGPKTPGRGERIHVVQPGDWLSKLAGTYYGDIYQWPTIFEANREVIGDNPDLIEPGMRLVIPA